MDDMDVQARTLEYRCACATLKMKPLARLGTWDPPPRLSHRAKLGTPCHEIPAAGTSPALWHTSVAPRAPRPKHRASRPSPESPDPPLARRHQRPRVASKRVARRRHPRRSSSATSGRTGPRPRRAEAETGRGGGACARASRLFKKKPTCFGFPPQAVGRTTESKHGQNSAPAHMTVTRRRHPPRQRCCKLSRAVSARTARYGGESVKSKCG